MKIYLIIATLSTMLLASDAELLKRIEALENEIKTLKKVANTNIKFSKNNAQ
jgi:hypothetical protein